MSSHQLNQAQQDAVETNDNILCCACPGSGKTRILVAKVSHILKTHPSPRIIMTTFSRDGADEMLKRIQNEKSIDRQQLRRLTIGTFHALALRQLKEHDKVGKILSEIEARYLILRCLHDTGLELSVEDADTHIARCKSDKVFAEDNPDYARLTACYRKYQREIGGQDFTDLLSQANEMMATGKLKPIGATHVLADEFQDIDRMQFDWLLHHLAQDPIACAVGDDDQSIYGFRRSLGHRGMMDFVAATNARIITLDTNYRSTSSIVDAASKLISYNIDRVPKKIKTVRGNGCVPKVVALPKEDSHAMRIIHRLDAICADNEMSPPLPNQEAYRFAVLPGQAAVLARTNSHLRSIEEVFSKERIPYLRTGRSFWDAPVLQVYLALLQALVSRDGMGLEIALRWARISEASIQELVQESGGNLWNRISPDAGSLESRATGNHPLDNLVTLGRGWAKKLASDRAQHSTQGIIDGAAGWMIGVMRKTSAHDDDGHAIKDKGARDVPGIKQVEAARESLAADKGPLKSRLMAIQRGDKQVIPRVILSTFHASKGLEWDHVFLTDVYDGSVPKVAEDSGDDELAEERRVFYVAMTRARDSLTIYSRTDKPVSEFLVDAGLSHLLAAT